MAMSENGRCGGAAKESKLPTRGLHGPAGFEAVGQKGMTCGKLGADMTVGEHLAGDELVHGASL
jgi:hypothetical protein